MYSLAKINFSPEEWDRAIGPYKSKYLFHESAWLDYLEQTQNGERLLLEIRAGDSLVGYFCGVVTRRGPFRILGSPLRGWWTPCMGPIVNELDPPAFLAALERYARANGIAYAEICNPLFSREVMEAAGYEAEDDITFLVPVGPKEEMWRRINMKARNKIRQSERKGVQVDVAHDRSAVEEYYQQLTAVFVRQGLTPPHPKKIVETMWDCLHARGRLLVLRATHEGRCVATYIGPVDDHTLYGLGWASWPDANSLRPNDLVQWKALTLATERGLTLYDMCGGGSFKPKFGGELVPRIRWHKSFSASASLAREIYKAYWFGRRAVLRRLRRMTRPGKPSLAGKGARA